MGYEFDGTVCGKLKEMQEARRKRYFELVSRGMNFTQAAESVGAPGARAVRAAPRGRSWTGIVGTRENPRR